jgi:integrase
MTRRSHGDGGIDQRGDNSFRLRYRIGRKRFSKTFRGTLAEAKKELRRLLRSGDTGEHVAPDKGTFAEWARQWLEAGAPGRRRRKVGGRALERYEQLLRTHVLPALGERKLQELQSTEIDRLYLDLDANKEISPGTARYVHNVLSTCLSAAVRTKRLSISPMESVTNVPSAGESDHGIALDDEQLKTLVQGFKGSALFGIVSVAAFTGARRNEILALRWSDLDPQKKELRIERALEDTKAFGLRMKGPKKESQKRTITIDDDLLTILLAEREKKLRFVAGVSDSALVDLSLVKLPEGALMFPNPPARSGFSFVIPRVPRALTKAFAIRARKLGFPGLRFHDLRGTHETLLLDNGVPPHVVAQRCGHDVATLLKNYAKRTKKADTSAAAVIGALSKTILGK